MSQHHYSLGESLNRAIAQDGGLSVFEHYGFSPSKRPQPENPFRNERTSSFFITQKNGSVFFKDFGDDSIKGDCRKFVQLYENCDYPEAFVKLCQIYGLIEGASPSRKPRKIGKAKPNKPEFAKVLREIQFKDFSQDELDYWQDKGGISLEVLQAEGLRSVQSFTLEVAPDKFQSFENLKYVFAYEIVPHKSYKLYQPKAAYRFYAPSKTVFLPNLDAAKQTFGKDYSYSFGLDSLRVGEKAILCGGEADCLALKAMGYNAFTLGNERGSIPLYIKQQLKAKQISQLSVLYDTDFTGLQAAQKLAKQENCQVLTLPKLEQQKSRDLPKPQANDFCDYLKLYGKDVDLGLCLAQEIFEYQYFKLPQVPQIPVKKYLQEKIDYLSAFIRQENRVQISANAGMGKTYSLLKEIAPHQDLPVIFAVPFAIQVEQIEQEYQESCPDLVCYSNQMLQDDAQAFLGFPPSKINVCTYDRLHLVYKKLQQNHQDNILLVVDESHLLTSEYGYRTQAINSVLDISETVKKVIYLSATPDYNLCQFSNFKLINFHREENPHINIKPHLYEGDKKEAISKILLEKFSHHKPKGITVVRLNNKTLAKTLANVLISKGILKSKEIDFVFSEARKSSETNAKKHIVEHSEIPKGLKLLFVTACFDCGINILNEDISEVISFEMSHTDNCKDTIKQFLARFRRLGELKLSIYKPAHCQDRPALKDTRQLYQAMRQDAEAKLTLIKYSDELLKKQVQQANQNFEYNGLQSPKNPSYLRANHDISAIHKLLRYQKSDDTYSINENYIRFMLKEHERKRLSAEAFFLETAQELPNCTLCQQEVLEKADTPSEIQAFWKEAKTQKENRTNKVCEMLAKDKERVFDAIQAEYCDISLKQKIKANYATSSVQEAPKIETLLQEHQAEQSAEDYDRELLLLSKRYFSLKNLLVPEASITKLLQKHQSEVKFGVLQKTLSNQILLRAYQKSGAEAALLFGDRRKLEDASWLHLFTDFIGKLEAQRYAQLKTQDWQRQLESLQYDLKLLEYEMHNLISLWFAELQALQEGVARKTAAKRLKKRIQSLQRRRLRLLKSQANLSDKLKQSQVEGIELEELSLLINRLRPQRSDWQGTRTNLRLLESLFKIEKQKRAILIMENGKETYKEKYIIKIGGLKSFKNALQDLGLNREESEQYQTYLDYQIHQDLEKVRKEVLSKNSKKSIESSNIISSNKDLLRRPHFTNAAWSCVY